MTTLKGNIYQCPDGHLYCQQCFVTTGRAQCPTCMSPMGDRDIRSRPLEKCRDRKLAALAALAAAAVGVDTGSKHESDYGESHCGVSVSRMSATSISAAGIDAGGGGNRKGPVVRSLHQYQQGECQHDPELRAATDGERTGNVDAKKWNEGKEWATQGAQRLAAARFAAAGAETSDTTGKAAEAAAATAEAAEVARQRLARTRYALTGKKLIDAGQDAATSAAAVVPQDRHRWNLLQKYSFFPVTLIFLSIVYDIINILVVKSNSAAITSLVIPHIKAAYIQQVKEDVCRDCEVDSSEYGPAIVLVVVNSLVDLMPYVLVALGVKQFDPRDVALVAVTTVFYCTAASSLLIYFSGTPDVVEWNEYARKSWTWTEESSFHRLVEILKSQQAAKCTVHNYRADFSFKNQKKDSFSKPKILFFQTLLRLIEAVRRAIFAFLGITSKMIVRWLQQRRRGQPNEVKKEEKGQAEGRAGARQEKRRLHLKRVAEKAFYAEAAALTNCRCKQCNSFLQESMKRIGRFLVLPLTSIIVSAAIDATLIGMEGGNWRAVLQFSFSNWDNFSFHIPVDFSDIVMLMPYVLGALIYVFLDMWDVLGVAGALTFYCNVGITVGDVSSETIVIHRSYRAIFVLCMLVFKLATHRSKRNYDNHHHDGIVVDNRIVTLCDKLVRAKQLTTPGYMIFTLDDAYYAQINAIHAAKLARIEAAADAVIAAHTTDAWYDAWYLAFKAGLFVRG